MTKQRINIGQSANDKAGDPLRTAFSKVNDNFDELYNSVSAVVVVGATAPAAPGAGDLWWNSESGRMYVYYGSAWVDASPVDGAGISSTNELVNGAYTVSLGTDGGLTFPSVILADLGGAEFGTGFSLTTDGDQAIIGASNLVSLETSGGYGQLHLTQDTETNKGRVEIFFQNGPGVLWIFDEEDSSLTFPDTTKQTTAWTGITGFGEGFGLTDTDKIVTNKLYSTNLTQPTQHYRLELDTNGVVVLPDGSIINGSTIRGVAGTGELNYTGITIGPNSNDAEKTWIWVDHANAYITTNNAANTWTFGNNGSTTFPANLKIADSVISNLNVVGDLSTGSQIQVGSGVAADTGIIISNSVTSSLGESGSVVNVNGSSAYMALKTVNSLGGDSTLTGEEMVEVSSSGVRIGVRVTNDLGDGSPPLVAFQGWTFGTDGSLTLPGAVVKSTVAKTGATIPTTTGPINNFDFSPLDGSGGLVDGTNIGPLTVGTMIFFAGVENGLPFGSYIQTQPILTIGDTIGTIDSGDLGGTPGTTFTLTVTNVVQETPTAIDLTKSVNKLTDGDYTLANGVEGQIMYLVRQTGSVGATVTVANARIDGFAQTNIPFSPFTDGTTDTNMATLIFTDGAWQNMGGYWNLT